jgi:hypothetical protein
MKFVRQIISLLLIPAVTFGQTVHVDSNRIVYKGTVKFDSVNKEALLERAKSAILSNVKGSNEVIVSGNNEKRMIAATGSMRLASPYHIIKTVEYIFELSIGDGKYEYRIDSVYIKQIERGGETIKISSEKLLKGMDVSGAVSANTEKQLNEIDMNFQKLIHLVNAYMQKAFIVKTRNS